VLGVREALATLDEAMDRCVSVLPSARSSVSTASWTGKAPPTYAPRSTHSPRHNPPRTPLTPAPQLTPPDG